MNLLCYSFNYSNIVLLLVGLLVYLIFVLCWRGLRFVSLDLQTFSWVCSVLGVDRGEFDGSASCSGSPWFIYQVCFVLSFPLFFFVENCYFFFTKSLSDLVLLL